MNYSGSCQSKNKTLDSYGDLRNKMHGNTGNADIEVAVPGGW